MSAAGDYNLEIIIGDTFAKTFTFYSDKAKTITKDLTGYSFKSQIRKCKSSSDVILEFESPATIDLSLANVGKIILRATDAVTGALAEQNAVYDLKWTDPSLNKLTVVEGRVVILEAVTK
jgi:hypothetical protein